MEPIIKNIVKLTSLANSLPLDGEQQQNNPDDFTSTNPKSNNKSQKKLAKKLFNQIIETQKYLNPANSKTLDGMFQETQSKEEYLLPKSEQDTDMIVKVPLSKKEQNKKIVKTEAKVHAMYQQYMQIINDDLVENVDKQVDQFKKKRRNQNDQGLATNSKSPVDHSKNFSARTSNTLRKPQHAWWKTIDNSYHQFVSNLAEKPNGITRGIPQWLNDAQENQKSRPKTLIKFGDHKIQNDQWQKSPNPYEAEINLQCQQIQEDSIEVEVTPKEKIVPFKSLEDVEFLFVDDEEKLTELVQHLKEDKITEIAVDLEAHSMRSYQGFLCLMQISTREMDFIVDLIKLRGQISESLRPIFDDPKKIKVLHGADSDILWLQRDFSLYIVNMFDTGQAARILQTNSFGLAHLLQRYCSVTANKQYQLADWRQRPLPSEMLKYAREDTHYLLYIYDQMRADLVQMGLQYDNKSPQNLLKQAMIRSNQICLKVWEKPTMKDHSYQMIIQRNQIYDSLAQTTILKALLKFRDYIARVEDESNHFVMPNQILFNIAKQMPVTINEFKDCCRNMYGNMMLKYQDQILDLIRTKLEKSKTKRKKADHQVFEGYKPAVNPEAINVTSSQIKLSKKFERVPITIPQLQKGNLPVFEFKQIDDSESLWSAPNSTSLSYMFQNKEKPAHLRLPEAKIKAVYDSLNALQFSELNILQKLQKVDCNLHTTLKAAGPGKSKKDNIQKDEEMMAVEKTEQTKEINSKQKIEEAVRLRDVVNFDDKNEDLLKNETQTLRQRFSEKKAGNKRQRREVAKMEQAKPSSTDKKARSKSPDNSSSSSHSTNVPNKSASASKWHNLYSTQQSSVTNQMKSQVDELKANEETKGKKGGKRNNDRRSGGNKSRGGSQSAGGGQRKYTIGNMRDDIIGKAVIK